MMAQKTVEGVVRQLDRESRCTCRAILVAYLKAANADLVIG